jgi:hypothetical protein
MIIFSCMICHRVCKKSRMTGVTSGAGTYPAISLVFIPSFSGVHLTLSLYLCSILWIIVCPFVICRLSDYPFGTFKLFLTCLTFKQYYSLMNFLFRHATLHLIQLPIEYDHHYELNYTGVNGETYERLVYPLK